MTTSNLNDVFSTTVTNFFANQVATHLSEWLKTNKNVEISEQELCGAFKVPYSPRPTMAGLPQSANMPTQMPNLPNYFHGTGASPVTRGGRGSRKKPQVDPNAPKCIYTFQRGNKKGKVCNDTVAQNGTPGSNEYCKNCLKKKTVQNRINSGSGTRSTVQPPIVPGGMVPVPDQQPSSAGENSINAVAIQGHPEMFRDTDNGFILKRCVDGSIVAVAMEEEGVQRQLTADEKKQAQLLGLSVMDLPTENLSVPRPVGNQTVPTIPTVPSVPQPVGNQTVPTIPSIPSVPQVSQVPVSQPVVSQPIEPQVAASQPIPSIPVVSEQVVPATTQ